MTKLVQLLNGVPRVNNISTGAGPTIYDEHVTIVASGAGANEMNGPVTSGSPVTLPGAKTYTAEELEVYVNGQRLEDVFDYSHASSTTVTFTFDLVVGDRIRFRIDRDPE